jgi:DNA-binding HxlR family transcriptional regulator
VPTARGQAIAPLCRDLATVLAGREDVALKKWSLPVLAALAEPRRFSELRTALPAASPRALALALKDLAGAGLVRRTVTAEYPPQVRYRATAAAGALVRAARALA